jgi:hypothetical protein
MRKGRGITYSPSNKNKKNGGRRKRKFRLLPPPIAVAAIKRGGFLPLILAGLGSLGALAGGASAIANAVKQAKKSEQELSETTRHNKVMESIAARGKGMYLNPPYSRKLGGFLGIKRKGGKRKTRKH